MHNISQPHYAVELLGSVRENLVCLQEPKGLLLEASVVKGRENIGDTHSLRNTFGLLELCFVESYVIILDNIVERSEQILLKELFAVLLFND
jgi:hypothetical protein